MYLEFCQCLSLALHGGGDSGLEELSCNFLVLTAQIWKQVIGQSFAKLFRGFLQQRNLFQVLAQLGQRHELE